MNRWAAYSIFGEMRPSTPAEQAEYKRMLKKHSIPTGRSIWDMDIEMDYCDICHKKKEVQRKYYYYGINCECCGSPQGHFEVIKHCKDCAPSPPKWIKAQVTPIERKIQPENWEYYE